MKNLKKRIMKLFINFFGTLMILSGISLLINPEIIFGWIEANMRNYSIYISAIIIRLVFGVLFIIVARKSKYPSVATFLGYVFIIAAIIFVFLGQENFQHLITSLIPNVRPYAPVSGLFSIVFGGFIVYAFSSSKEIEQK